MNRLIDRVRNFQREETGRAWLRKAHSLKVEQVHFNEIISKRKTCEVRYNDRDYLVGDILFLYEYSKEEDELFGRSIEAVITHVETYEQKEGFVVLSFKRLKF